MSRSRPQLRRRIIYLPLILMFMASCGVKSMPLPANQLIPAAPGKPTYTFTDDGLLVVSFQPPLKTITGRTLRDLGGFYVDKSENRIQAGFCTGCPVEYTKRINIPPLNHGRGNRLLIRPTNLKIGWKSDTPIAIGSWRIIKRGTSIRPNFSF